MKLGVSYSKEYGEDTFELQKSVDLTGKKVLIVDDILATGAAAKNISCLFLHQINIPNLDLSEIEPYYVLLKQ